MIGSGGLAPILTAIMTLDVSEDESHALAKQLRQTIDGEPCRPIQWLDPPKSVLAKRKPPPRHLEPLMPGEEQSSPRREAGMARLALAALCLAWLLSACATRGNSFAGPDPGGGFPCPHNAFEDCADPSTSR
jgi:hypothetical protein